jgi:superfamily I DNA/RNA helicase
MLLCHNALLGTWLRQQTQAIAIEAQAAGRPMIVGTVSSLMLKIAGISIPDVAGKDFWTNELPTKALDALLRGDSGFEPCNLLIIDEAQDLMTDEILDILELVTAGGLAGGRWIMFGDFERQAIYANADAQPGLERLRTRTGQAFANFPLRINCRNTKNIAAAVTLTSGLAPGYSRVLQSEEGSDVIPSFYRSADQQLALLKDGILRLLRKHGPNSIVVLSMRADRSASSSRLGDSLNGVPIFPFDKVGAQGRSAIHYGSVHAFKGMESAAVIFTDIEEIEGDQSRALLYVGMTRARLDLVVLMNERLRESYARMLTAGLRAQRETRT